MIKLLNNYFLSESWSALWPKYRETRKSKLNVSKNSRPKLCRNKCSLKTTRKGVNKTLGNGFQMILYGISLPRYRVLCGYFGAFQIQKAQRNALLSIVKNKNMLNIPGHTWLGQEQHWLVTDLMIQTSFCFKNDNTSEREKYKQVSQST